MQVFFSNYSIQNTKNKYSTNPIFKGALKQTPVCNGYLKRETKFMVEDFLHAFLEIKAWLEKTLKGIEHLNSIYPAITIGEGLVFHNCGDKNNSIVIRKAEAHKYQGLTYMLV